MLADGADLGFGVLLEAVDLAEICIEGKEFVRCWGTFRGQKAIRMDTGEISKIKVFACL